MVEIYEKIWESVRELKEGRKEGRKVSRSRIHEYGEISKQRDEQATMKISTQTDESIYCNR